MTAPLLRAALPQLLVADVRASVAWCERVLEMRAGPIIGGASAVFAIVGFAEPGQAFHLARAPAGDLAPFRRHAYVRTSVAEVERRLVHVRAQDAERVEGPVDRPWLAREIVVADPDGHGITFGGDLRIARDEGALRLSPELFVTDIARSLAFFQDVLGFTCGATFGDPPIFASLERDRVIMHLVRVPQQTRPNRAIGRYDVYFECSGVDEIHARLRARGARLVRDLAMTPHGIRELEIEDPDGHGLAFGEPIGGWDDHAP